MWTTLPEIQVTSQIAGPVKMIEHKQDEHKDIEKKVWFYLKNKNAFNPIVNKTFGSIQSFYFHDSIQYLKYWFNPIPQILMQSNTYSVNIDAIFWNFFSVFLGRARPTGTRVTKHKRALKNMAGEEEFDLEVEFTKFLAEVDKNWNTSWGFWLRSCTRSRRSSWSNHWSASPNEPLLRPRPGGVLPEKLGGVCGPLTKTITLFMTWLLNQNPVSDQRYNKFPSSDEC